MALELVDHESVDAFAAMYDAIVATPGLSVKMPETVAELYRVGVSASVAPNITVVKGRVDTAFVYTTPTDPLSAVWSALDACGVRTELASLDLSSAIARELHEPLAKHIDDWASHAAETCRMLAECETYAASRDAVLPNAFVKSAIRHFDGWVRANFPPERALSVHYIRFDLVIDRNRVASVCDLAIGSTPVDPALSTTVINTLCVLPSDMLNMFRAAQAAQAARATQAAQAARAARAT